VTEPYKLLKPLFLSFSDSLNPSVRKIPNPTRDSDSSSYVCYLSSKQDSLHKAPDHDSSARMQPWTLGVYLVDIIV